MNDDIERSLGRVEGTIERLTKAVDDLSARVLSMERKLYYYAGATAVGVFLLTHPEKILGLFTMIAKAGQ